MIAELVEEYEIIFSWAKAQNILSKVQDILESIRKELEEIVGAETSALLPW